MLNQIRYFQAVVQYHSFTEAAEQCHISQSAISQQIQSLENELGVKLLNRQRKKFSLTPAGEHYYRKSLVLVEDYDRMVRETKKIANHEEALLRVGVLLTYGGKELQLAASAFSQKYPNVDFRILTGSHEELFDAIRSENVDISMSDQRRAFNSDYENVILQKNRCWIEIARDNPMSKLDYIEPEELRNVPCILVADEGQEENERKYYAEIYGFEGEFLYASTIKEARLMVVSNRGFLPTDGEPVLSHFDETIARVPFYKGNTQFTRNLCLFWKKDNSGYYVEEFAEMLEDEFHQKKTV